MNIAPFQEKITTRHVRQSILTLVLFLVTFFAHIGHFTQIENDDLSALELHDCNLCQQGIDTPPAPFALNPVSEISSFLIITEQVSAILFHLYYVSPQLRAPPSLL